MPALGQDTQKMGPVSTQWELHEPRQNQNFQVKNANFTSEINSEKNLHRVQECIRAHNLYATASTQTLPPPAPAATHRPSSASAAAAAAVADRSEPARWPRSWWPPRRPRRSPSAS